MLFGQEEDYWRGKVWVNINYLVLQALKQKYSVEGPFSDRCSEVYKKLRENLISNVIRQVGEEDWV